MPGIVRIGDNVSCGDVMAQGSGNVFANSIPVSRQGVDFTAGHCYPPITVISAFSPNVFANTINVDRVGSVLPTHCCEDDCHGPNSMTVGSGNVLVNEPGQSGGGGIVDFSTPFTAGSEPTGMQPGTTPVEQQVFENEDPDDPTATIPVDSCGVIPNTAPLVGGNPVQEDNSPAPVEAVPTQDCSTVSALPNNFTWTSVAGSFSSWANSFSLSSNFTVADLTINPAVSTWEFTAAVTQASGLTQKQILLNLCFHAKTILEPLRSLVGAFTITSGFRNKSGSSQHNKGQATDIQFLNFHGKSNTGQLYYERAIEVRDSINFDQLILEWFARNPWLHISSNRNGHRHTVLTQTSPNGYTKGLKRLR